MTNTTRLNVVNLVLFQIGWFACVLSAAAGSAWIGIVTVTAIVAWHLRIARRPAQELALLLMVGAIGFIFESLQRYYGILVYGSHAAAAGLASVGTDVDRLGVIPTPEIKNARQHIHRILDPLWKSKRWKRGALYAELGKRLGYEFHTAEIKSVEEARKIYRIVKELSA